MVEPVPDMTAPQASELASPLTDPLATGGPALLTHYGGSSGNGTDRQQAARGDPHLPELYSPLRHTITTPATL